MKAKGILLVAIVGMLSACVSGTNPPDTYVGKDGKSTRIESDNEMCTRSCNQDYSRCMDTGAASTNDGQYGPSGVYGASADCRNSLQSCLHGCKTQ